MYSPLYVADISTTAFDFVITGTNVEPGEEPVDGLTVERLRADMIPTEVSEGRNRFQLFALGKVLRLMGRPMDLTSHNPNGEIWEPGEFGVCGAVRSFAKPVDGTIFAASGGFQLDDHVIAVLGLSAGRQIRELERELDEADWVRLESNVTNAFALGVEEIDRQSRDEFQFANEKLPPALVNVVAHRAAARVEDRTLL
jgi:hypothetical protein